MQQSIGLPASHLGMPSIQQYWAPQCSRCCQASVLAHRRPLCKTRRRKVAAVKAQARKQPELEAYQEVTDKSISVRSEVEAPFRTVRLVFCAFFVISAGVGALIQTTQLIGALAQAENAFPLQSTLEGLAIDFGGIGLFGFLFRQDWKARDKQIARLTREERLGSLQLELANRRTLRLSQLRGFARVVIVAGTRQQVEEAVDAAEPLREQLTERGVLVVPLPIFDEGGNGSSPKSLAPEDMRWKATPLRTGAWKDWFLEQMQLANKLPEKGLYIGLRLDGRVRASGTGQPPWQMFAAQLPPVKGGLFSGFLDGLDGRV